MRKASFIKFVCIGLLLILISCSNDNETAKVDYTYSFCDGNSKVWMVSSVYRGNDLIETRNDLTSKVFVFYKSGRFVYGDLVDLAENEFEDGTYDFESASNYLEMKFSTFKWTFLFEFKDENCLILRPEKRSDSDLTFELIPFPEPV
jgi:hypothetical protein